MAPILRALQFTGERGTEPLLAAFAHFRAHDGVLTKAAPDEFLEPPERLAVHTEGRFPVSLYKAFLFVHVQSALRSGSLNPTHSYKYRPLGAYLMDRERWRGGRRAAGGPRGAR
ncbi:MAG: hypothetical protein ACE141_16735 [Bryobacteraceae bacterium]